jgi:hypothetical protein
MSLCLEIALETCRCIADTQLASCIAMLVKNLLAFPISLLPRAKKLALSCFRLMLHAMSRALHVTPSAVY